MKTVLRKVRHDFVGRMESGPVVCPVCGRNAVVHAYGQGELWTTLQCARCGWYSVPTMHASPRTEWHVICTEEVEVHHRRKK